MFLRVSRFDIVYSFFRETFVNKVKSTYPEEHWGVEMEANLLEVTATADEIAEMFTEACLGG